jgi:hypothetical protein
VKVNQGVTVSDVVVINATTIAATFTIPADATTGQRSVTVTNRDKGKGKLTNAFEVT